MPDEFPITETMKISRDDHTEALSGWDGTRTDGNVLPVLCQLSSLDLPPYF